MSATFEEFKARHKRELIDHVCSVYPTADRARLTATIDKITSTNDIQVMASMGIVEYDGLPYSRERTPMFLIDLATEHDEFYLTIGALTCTLETEEEDYLTKVEAECLSICGDMPEVNGDPQEAVALSRWSSAKVLWEMAHGIDGLSEDRRSNTVYRLLVTIIHKFKSMGDTTYEEGLNRGLAIAPIVINKGDDMIYTQLPLGAYMPEEARELIDSV